MGKRRLKKKKTKGQIEIRGEQTKGQDKNREIGEFQNKKKMTQGERDSLSPPPYILSYLKFKLSEQSIHWPTYHIKHYIFLPIEQQPVALALKLATSTSANQDIGQMSFQIVGPTQPPKPQSRFNQCYVWYINPSHLEKKKDSLVS